MATGQFEETLSAWLGTVDQTTGAYEKALPDPTEHLSYRINYCTCLYIANTDRARYLA